MEPTTSRVPRPDPGPDPRVLAALLACEADLAALERGLLVLGTHAVTGGADEAWLVRHDAARGLLEGWAHAVRSGDEDLTSALARARRQPPTESPEHEALRAWAVMPESFDGACDRAWRSGEPSSGPGAETPGAPWDAMSWIRVVPLRRGHDRHGLLVSGWRVRPAHESDDASLAVVAEAALGAQCVADEALQRTTQSRAIAEFARTTVSASNVAETSHALVRLTTQALQVRWSALWRVREDGTLRLEVAHGPAPGRDTMPRALHASATGALPLARAVHGVGAETLPAGAEPRAEGLSRWVFQPLVAHGTVYGVLAAWEAGPSDAIEGAWPVGALEALTTLADQAALLFEHARDRDARAALERRRDDLLSRLREQDRWVALGEMSARVADEARQPLSALRAFVTRGMAELGPEDPAREAFLGMERELARVERLLGEQSEYARLEPPRLRMESLNTVVQEALRTVAEPLARHRVRLVKTFAPDLPTLLLDGARIRRVVGNIVMAALEQLPMGGRVRIETRRAGAWLVFEVLHDRARADGDALEQLFAPFAASLGPAASGAAALPPSGAALGLGVAHQIVREHGGELRVRIEDEWSSAFVMTLPVMENQDRRKGPDRRGVRRDRRRRDEEA